MEVLPEDISSANSFYTPCKAQKRLFGAAGSSSKKCLFQNENIKRSDPSSGEESDLGPMSPLAFTDRSPSSCGSNSPGRRLLSPSLTSGLLTSFRSSEESYDRLTPKSKCRSIADTSPFSTLKKLTKAARASPARKIFSDIRRFSPDICKQFSDSEDTENINTTVVTSQTNVETSPRKFGKEVQNNITETPHKSDVFEDRLITPLGSVTKVASTPKLHRRKSTGAVNSVGCSSAEKEQVVSLKRHAYDALVTAKPKLAKSSENCTIPKARAALFQEKQSAELQEKNFTLSTKTFYKNDAKRMRPFNLGTTRSLGDVKRRHSLPVRNNTRNGSLVKVHRWSGINAGVFHRIRKPKLKRAKDHVSPSKASVNNLTSPEKDVKVKEVVSNTECVKLPVERETSPEVDASKRFFKTKWSTKQHSVATVTVNHKVKLKVVNGKITFNQANLRASNNRKYKEPANTTLDTTDLTVDEPLFDNSSEKKNVDDILKILEDDWADDDYDTMESLTNLANPYEAASPTKSVRIPDETAMSPASILSDMTSTMNIKDVSTVRTTEDITEGNKESSQDSGVDSENVEPKYYPLFAKGYSMPDTLGKEDGARKSSKGVKRNLKRGCGEDQYQLDCGQKRFGATQCSECNLVYQLGEPEDENAHLNYHNSRKTLRFEGWKKEHVVMEDPGTSSRIILVTPDNVKQSRKKISDILEFVDRDLGLADTSLSDYKDKKIYLYIREKMIIGVLVAELIESAHRMIPELLPELDCCTAESTPAKCGVNVVWTLLTHRRRGIATKLVDILRATFYYGYVMTVDDIAFSVPTPSGKTFAEKYTKTRGFKVYS